MILPVAKLGTLLLRQLTKPLAAQVKRVAVRNEVFREWVTGVAQKYHRYNVNMQRRLYAQDTDVEIRPLNAERALQTAADLVGEVTIFSVAAGILVWEYQRNAQSDYRKTEAAREAQEKSVQRSEEMDAKLREALEMNKATQEELRQLKERLGLLEASKSGQSAGHQVISLLPPSLPLSLPPSENVESQVSSKQMEAQSTSTQQEAQELPKKRTGWLPFS
ncbi:hypothetical protein KFL_000220350 [Klebsormidium nitens]|uniref:OPA3-like protein n=1 Tax=Klebsormidium nitens TaxID=105231 RepID=A0A1Y1HKA3_KLENI|nr:hypothetical protein KFL_000220350 [Klebsormidium nitens]|eukprot:GAQ79004.1 hypothetical protein KFL_000220350 [Klebsormidium nitens]